MAKKIGVKKSTRSNKNRTRSLPDLAPLDQNPMSVPPSPSTGFGLKTVVWVAAIAVLFFVMFKDKVSCRWGVSKVPVKFISKIGLADMKEGPFTPTCLSPLGKDRIIVSDEEHLKVVVMGLDGQYKGAVGRSGKGSGLYQHNTGVSTDPDGNVYVLDHSTADVYGYRGNGDPFLHVSSKPTGYFYGPRGLAYANGNFAIADTGSCRVVVMDPAGQTVHNWGTRGTGDKQFISPNGILVTSEGHYIVSDFDNRRVKVLGADGAVLKIIKLEEKPAAIAKDAAGRLLVAYATPRFVEVFNLANGRKLGTLEVDRPDTDLAYRNVSAMCVVDGNKLITGDSRNLWIYQLSN